jgi:hypothetical protein
MNSHPLYIAPDEEIISVIARLRGLPEQEVTLVFPKTSVVTQSIINLKLLAREGEKLQKTLTLVSQNENARNLAEKLGFTTLPYTSDLEKGNVYLQSSGEAPLTEIARPIKEPLENMDVSLSESNETKLHSAQIGSSSFHTVPQEPITPQTLGDIKVSPEALAPEEPSAVSLRVRNNSPERPPSLNSVRYQETFPNTPAGAPEGNTIVSEVSAPSQAVLEERDTPLAIKNFFNRETPSAAVSFQQTKDKGAVGIPVQTIAPGVIEPPQASFVRKESFVKKLEPVMVGAGTSKKLVRVLWSIVFLVIISSGALFFFLAFPKAMIFITPQTLEESTDQTFSVALTENGSGEITLEKVTRELTVSIAGIASGAGGSGESSSGSKAKGKIKVTNTYSAEAQPLVATTRFETGDGKIYRTPVAITIPGNGSIEIEVIADGSGETYNKDSGTLTIPGFKGSDKYEKITASMTSSITGGGGKEQKAGGTFIRADEEILRQRAADAAKQMFSDEVSNTTGDSYTFIDGLVAERVTEENIPKVGSTPGEYTYNAVFKVTAYTTSQEAVTKNLLRNIKTEYDGINFTPTGQKLEFTDFTVDEKGERATLKAHLDTTLKAVINEDVVKKDLSGKSAEEMKNFTEVHPEIRSLEATFEPTWALKRIPSDTKRIELLIQ